MAIFRGPKQGTLPDGSVIATQSDIGEALDAAEQAQSAAEAAQAAAEAALDDFNRDIKDLDGQAVGTRPDEVPTNADLRVDTLSDLQALDTGDARSVQLLGRSSVADGGGGLFVWDGSDLSSEVGDDEMDSGEGNGGIYVAPDSDKSGESGAWVRILQGEVLPEWYGAKGDGANDDTSAIQAAIDAVERQGGGVVYLGRLGGDYRIASAELVVDTEGVHIDMAKGVVLTQTDDQYEKSCLQLRASNCSVRGTLTSTINQGSQTPDSPGDKSEIDGSYEGQPARDRAAGVYVAEGVEGIDIDITATNFVNSIKLNGTESNPIKRVKIRLVSGSMDFGVLAVAVEDLDAIVWGYETWPSQGVQPHAVYISGGGFQPSFVNTRFEVITYDAGNPYSGPTKVRASRDGFVRTYAQNVARGIEISECTRIKALFIGDLVESEMPGGDSLQAGFRIEESTDITTDPASRVYLADDLDDVFCAYLTNSEGCIIRGFFRSDRDEDGNKGLIRLDSSSNDNIIDRPVLRIDGDIECRGIELIEVDNNTVIDPIVEGSAPSPFVVRIIGGSDADGNTVHFETSFLKLGWQSETLADNGENTVVKVKDRDEISDDNGDNSVTLVAGQDDTTQRWETDLTGDRSCDLSNSGAYEGARFRIVRRAGGGYDLDVGDGPLKTLSENEWCEVQYKGGGSGWILTAFGSL